MLGRVGGALILLLLLARLLLACGQMLHGQMLGWGEDLWPGYAMMRPACEAAPAPVGPTPQGEGVATSGAAGAPGAAPLAPKAAPVSAAENDLLDDLLGDDGPADPATPATDDAAGALDADLAAAGTGSADDGANAQGAANDAGGDADDELGDLLEGLDTPPAVAPAAAGTRPSAGGAPSAGRPRVDPAVQARLTDGFMTYCRVEKQIARLSDTGVNWMTPVMVLLLLLAGIIATIRRSHIVLRNATNPMQDRVTNLAQLLANLAVAASAWAMVELADEGEAYIQHLWITGVLLMAAVNVFYLIRPMKEERVAPGSNWGRATAAIPLYAWMGIIGGLYFFLVEHHPAGIAIYLQKITEYASLYLQVGLYLWTGMLLRDTRLGRLSFDLLRPMGLPAGLFAVIVVLAAAVPTAYSGASGILVLALGATIYLELRRAGCSDALARASTAMSGSFGVVLPPCLLVIIVASLNLEVTTDELFFWGWRIFGGTAVIFLFFAWLTRREPWRINPPEGAGADFKRALRAVAPYLIIGASVLLFFRFVFDEGLNERTAPYVLPIAMLLILPWDRWQRRKDIAAGKEVAPVGDTSLDTGTNVGALLMLMGLSAVLGGVIERSEIIMLFPQDLGGPLGAMALIMMALVVIGMIMDPYGAVILVSVTIYPIALNNGIHPLNFWMTALVSFELGYLTPPVALNHLLTRAVVSRLPGHEEEDPHPPGASLYRRHERVLLPILVRGTTLLIVAFGPILFG